jgi:hypothetical protein
MIIGSINSEIIKILFDTNKESLFLGDIIKVSNKDNTGILAQVIKIDSSKDKLSCNVASCKILFTLISGSKLVSWRGNVPSKDNAVSILSNEEILAYIGLNRNSNISIGQLTLYQGARFKFDTSSLKNPTVILCDKQEQRINMFHLLSQEIIKSGQKVVLLDLRGEFADINYASRLIAGKDFKLPLNSKGIDILYEKTLTNASVETKAVIEDIFMSVQEYADESEQGFIPFSSFKQVVENEYNMNNIPELVLLKNKLTKLDKEGIFANNEDEIDIFNSHIGNNNLCILDLSDISSLWHKEFIDSIINFNIRNDNSKFFLMFEGLDKNFDDNLINKLYIHGIKSGIKPVISIGYESAYINNILTVAKNLIFFSPSIQTDKFPAFNSFINRLDSSESLIIGQITKTIPLFIQIDQVILNNEMEENFESENEEEIQDNVLISSENQPVSLDIEDEFYEHYEEQEAIKIQPEYDIPEELVQPQFDDVDTLYTTQKSEQEIPAQDIQENFENNVMPTPDIPVYSTADEAEEKEFNSKEGDAVRHQKYGEGIIKKIIGYGNKKLCSIEFSNVGRRLLDPNLAVIEKV